MRRFVLLALSIVLGASAAPRWAAAAVPVVVVDGRGWGHGVGLAQDGAYWMATDGASMDQILGHFYPGALRGSHAGAVRVVVHVSSDDRVVLALPEGGEVRSPRSGPQHPGFPVSVPPGGAVTITRDAGGYVVSPSDGAVAAASARRTQLIPLPTTTTTAAGGSTTTSTWRLLRPAPPTTTSTLGLLPTAPPTTTATPPAPTSAPPTTSAPAAPSAPAAARSPEPVWAGPVSAGGTIGVPARGLRYRGEVEVAGHGGPLRVVNELDVEQYLWGLGEVGASFPRAAIQAQIVAARTYALRAMAANGEICDTQRCQVYKGVNGEFPEQVEAVSSTLGTTLTWGGGFASTVYSANAAGVSATPSEGFGNPDAAHPYLVARAYVTRSPDPWEVRIGLADLAARLGYPGAATRVRIATTGPSGRPLELELDGDAGPVRVSALEANRAMGLRSTMWALRVELADAAPEAPEAVERIQAAPDVVGGAIEEETTRMLAASTSADRVAPTLHDAPAPPGGDDEPGPPRAWLLIVPVLAAGAAGATTLRRTTHP